MTDAPHCSWWNSKCLEKLKSLASSVSPKKVIILYLFNRRLLSNREMGRKSEQDGPGQSHRLILGSLLEEWQISTLSVLQGTTRSTKFH